MEKLFRCSMCKEEIFEGENAEHLCNEHEKTCRKTIYFRDDFSGEVISYHNSTKFDMENEYKKSQCHILRMVDVPNDGEFQGEKVEFLVTDNSLKDMCRCLTKEAQLRIFGEIRYTGENER